MEFNISEKEKQDILRCARQYKIGQKANNKYMKEQCFAKLTEIIEDSIKKELINNHIGD